VPHFCGNTRNSTLPSGVSFLAFCHSIHCHFGVPPCMGLADNQIRFSPCTLGL
jgi:hypothetical protein